MRELSAGGRAGNSPRKEPGQQAIEQGGDGVERQLPAEHLRGRHLVGALPPPGVHALVYAGAARYDTLRGNSGQSLLQDFKVDVNVLAPCPGRYVLCWP